VAVAGLGMARYHPRVKDRGWRRRRVINLIGGVYTGVVVVVFAVVKFTEGAWVIVILFPLLVYGLIQVNRRYRVEAEVLENLGGGGTPHPPDPTPPAAAGRRRAVTPAA